MEEESTGGGENRREKELIVDFCSSSCLEWEDPRRQVCEQRLAKKRLPDSVVRRWSEEEEEEGQRLERKGLHPRRGAALIFCIY